MVVRTCCSARWSTRRVSKPALSSRLAIAAAPPVLHNAYEAPRDGSQAVVLANWTSNAQRLTLI